jgi:hypothetical protein
VKFSTLGIKNALLLLLKYTIIRQAPQFFCCNRSIYVTKNPCYSVLRVFKMLLTCPKSLNIDSLGSQTTDHSALFFGFLVQAEFLGKQPLR